MVGKRVFVDYDAPGLYCSDTGEWPPNYTCTNDPEAAADRISLFDGGGGLIRRAYIYFENGTWDTGIDIAGCGQTVNYQAAIRVFTSGGFVSAFSAVTPLTSTCNDRKECPGGTSVGLPINVGSGDVMVRQPLFTIGQDPLPLPFTMTYHSSTPMFPSLVSEPVGKGWTHEYNQTLKPEPGTNGDRLYRISPEGYEEEYLRIPPATTWIAINPGELRGTVTQVGNDYKLTDLNGTLTIFDVTTGRWKSTADRWGNPLSGTYNGSNQLTTITDSMGRATTLAHSGTEVTVTLPNSRVWKLRLAGALLTAIRDPFHPSTDWRTYTYVNDHLGVQRLLTSIKDDATPPKELEAHTYDNTPGTGTDRALTSSQLGGTRSNVTITYDSTTQRTVKHRIDNSPVVEQTTVFTLAYLVGRWLPTQISGNCASCGGGDSDLQVLTYDYSNHVLSRKDGDPGQGEQVETQFTYNGDGVTLSKTEAVATALERRTTYTYAAATPPNFLAPWPAFMTSMTEQSAAKPGQSKTTTYTWSNSGSVCSGSAAERCLETASSGFLKSADASPTVYTTSSTFDSRHRLTSIVGPATNQKVVHIYNNDAATNNGGRRSQTQVYTSATAHLDTLFASYDLYGTAGTVTDPNQVQTVTTTDDRGRVLTVVSKHPTSPVNDTNEPGDYTTTYAYDTRERLTSVTLPRGNRITYAYEDGTNRLTDTIRAESGGNQRERVHLTLNAIGGKELEEFQICGTPAPNCTTWTTQRTESFTYDTHNRLQRVTHADATTIDYTYDTRGNLKTIKEERHASANTTYSYDALNRLTNVSQTLSLGSISTSYGYDVHDNLASVTDPNGNQTTYASDDFRRMQTQASVVTGTTNYTYDAAGNLTMVVDANSATTTRTFDAANRILTLTSTLANRPTETVSWAYDNPAFSAYGMGRLVAMTDPTGTTKYVYERRGLLRHELKSVWDNTYKTSYGYDANGNRTSVTYPSKRAVTYTYDFADRHGSANGQLPGGPLVTYITSTKYKPFGPPEEYKFGNGTTRAMTYDQRYRMTRNKLTKDSPLTTLADYGLYAYDGAGNVTSIPDAVDPSYSRTSMAYDDLNRLTSASTGSNLWQTGTYIYDSMGNVSSLSLSSGGTLRSASFTYSGTTPKISSVTEQAPIGMRNVTYDATGNETAVGSGSYVYSSRNLLASGDGFAYSYDGRGVRTSTRQDVISITELVPTSRPAGQGAFTLTVNGSKFTGSSVVKWNGVNRTTMFVSSTQLTASILSGDVSSAGTIAQVTVTDGAATSNTARFVVDFSDVAPPPDTFYTAITTIAARGITTGCNPGLYCPNDSTTRAQMAIFLLRAQEGGAYTPPACVPPGPFTDVPCGSTFAPYIQELVARGITSGCAPGLYCPDDPVTREQMAVFLLRTLEGSSVSPPPAIGIFSDVPSGGFFAPYIEEIARRGVTFGCAAGLYCPTNPVTRAQMALFLTRNWGFTLQATPAGQKRFFLYNPELNVIAESEYTTAYHPLVFYEHIWMNGAPVAEVDTGTSTTHWTLTDHLGTPIMWTDSAVTTNWRVEHEPYGRIYKLRAGSNSHQALRLPGQEAEQLAPNETALNGGTEKSYNIFRWYRFNWGRYTQADPAGLSPSTNLFAYVDGNPTVWIDPRGLCSTSVCCNDYDRLKLNDRLTEAAAFQGAFINGTPGPPRGEFKIGGFTTCSDGPNGRAAPGMVVTMITGSTPGVCIEACTKLHEQSHRDLCTRRGVQGFINLGRFAEALAYGEEVRCLTEAILTGRVNTCKLNF